MSEEEGLGKANRDSQVAVRDFFLSGNEAQEVGVNIHEPGFSF